MGQELQDLYNSKLIAYSTLLKKVENKIKFISTARLLTALVIVSCFYFALTSNHLLFYGFFLLIFLFAALVIVHSRHFKRKNILQNFVRINKEEAQALSGINDAFDKGNDFFDPEHAYSYDLDIFGDGSLFQFLNRTVTYEGKESLARYLSDPDLQLDRIQSRQESVKELSAKLDFRQQYRALGLELKESSQDRENLKNWMADDYYFTKQRFLKYLVFILPSLAFFSIIFSILQGEVSILVGITVLLNVLIYGQYAKKVTNFYSQISRKKLVLENYSEMFGLIEKQNFISPQLSSLSLSLKDASFQFKKLSQYVGWMDQRLNILFMPIANFIFLYDLHCCLVIEKWKIRNDTHVGQWMKAAGEIDALSSLANMSYNFPAFIFPNVKSGKPLLFSKALAHPLIYKNKVSNDFKFDSEEKIAVITGANMSGKSTFLRAVGVNAVLAFAGAPVCAELFEISLMEIHSSMRISDSLKDHTSYFYAELRRLKAMKESLEEGRSCLVLLDEMLKGTNSNDKQQGSKVFMESLLQYSCLALMATHDLELGKLEREYPGKILNFSFESFVVENKLTFDYKIKKGIAVNTNAIFLMKDMGII